MTDDKKRTIQIERSISLTTTLGDEKILKLDHDSSLSNDSISRITFIPIETEAYDTDFSVDDIIYLPPKSSFSNFHRTRQRTTTNHFELNDTEKSGSDHHENSIKWGFVPEKNDENERDELILYVQRNSRMLFAGIFEKHLITDAFLQKLVR